MDFKICSISPEQIDTTDVTFRITTNSNTKELVRSLSAIGLLHPPVLVKKGTRLTIVCGFRRIAASAALKFTSIPVRILPANVSRMKCARIAISDNAFQRALNVVEQARAFKLIRRFTGRSTVCLEVALSTGLPASRKAMDRLLAVADMPIRLQNAIVDGYIAVPVALQIKRLLTEDTAALCRFFHKINAGLNVQRELLALLTEISFRDDISIAELIEHADVHALLENQASSAPQKVAQLRRIFKARRYPELSKAEEAFKQTLKSLKLNPRIKLQPPPFFEGQSYRLTLTIESRQQLKRLQPELEKLVAHPQLIPK